MLVFILRLLRSNNETVIKKFLNTLYFVACKKWAVRENFSDIILFLKGLGDGDIFYHLQQASARASYISTTSTDEFLKCLSNHLENGFLDRLTAASEFSLMSDETMDIADQAELAIFVCYVDSDKHSITEEFLGFVDIVGSKGAEALCEKICEVLIEKGVVFKYEGSCFWYSTICRRPKKLEVIESNSYLMVISWRSNKASCISHGITH